MHTQNRVIKSMDMSHRTNRFLLLCTEVHIDGISFSFFPFSVLFLDHPHNELVLNFFHTYTNFFFLLSLIYASMLVMTKDIRECFVVDDNN